MLLERVIALLHVLLEVLNGGLHHLYCVQDSGIRATRLPNDLVQGVELAGCGSAHPASCLQIAGGYATEGGLAYSQTVTKMAHAVMDMATQAMSMSVAMGSMPMAVTMAMVPVSSRPSIVTISSAWVRLGCSSSHIFCVDDLHSVLSWVVLGAWARGRLVLSL